MCQHLTVSIHIKLEFPVDAIDTFLDSRIQKIVSGALFWGQPGEICLFVLSPPFTHMNKLQSVLNILGTEHNFVPFTALYINFRADKYKLNPR